MYKSLTFLLKAGYPQLLKGLCVGRGKDSSPQALLSVHSADGGDVSVDDAGAGARSLLDSDLLRQMHRMRHQDHKDEGLNLTRSVLAARASKVGLALPQLWRLNL